MVMKLEEPESAYLNKGKYKPCKDTTIGSLIEYLKQFPPNWPIIVGMENREELVLVDCSLVTSLQMIGENCWGTV